MSVLIHDPHLARDYINQRQLKGLDRYDEVWDGVTVVMPLPTIDRQKIAVRISGIVLAGFDFREPPHIFAGVNVSDYVAGWTKNFRCPDVAVFLEHTTAVNCDTHWCGGPDFLIEYDNVGFQNDGKHIHAILREKGNDFGADILKQHYLEAKH